MNIIKLRHCSCTASRALTCTQQPTAVVESFSRGALEAFSDSSGHKGSYRMEPAHFSSPSLHPNFLVLLCACMSGGALPQIRRCNSCSGGLRALQHMHGMHISGLPQQQESIHQRLKTPTDARHYAKLPRPHVISDIDNCTAALLGPLCRIASMLGYQTGHTHAGTHACSMSIFGVIGLLIPSTAPNIQILVSEGEN